MQERPPAPKIISSDSTGQQAHHRVRANRAGAMEQTPLHSRSEWQCDKHHPWGDTAIDLAVTREVDHMPCMHCAMRTSSTGGSHRDPQVTVAAQHQGPASPQLQTRRPWRTAHTHSHVTEARMWFVVWAHQSTWTRRCPDVCWAD